MDYSNEEKLKKIQQEKEAAIEAKDFGKAAKLRDEEKLLAELLGNIPTTPSTDMSKKEIKNTVIVLLLLCLTPVYFSYQLFVNNIMWCDFEWVKVSNRDILFWVYAAALIVPIAILVFVPYVKFTHKRK